MAGRLTVEVTETTAVSNIEDLVDFAAFLRGVGCALAIDDFGAGHTSFLALSQVAVDWVKIDGSFLVCLDERPDNLVFIDTLVRLARHFGTRTVAEWVADAETAKQVAAVGVDALQGYFVGRPELDLAPEVAAALPGPLRFAAPGEELPELPG